MIKRVIMIFVDSPMTSVLIALKAGIASLNARISVGQTKVKSLQRDIASDSVGQL